MTQQQQPDEHAQLEDHIKRRYDILEFKGKGAYGIVWKASDKKTKQIVALKKVFDAFQNSTDAQRTYREVVFLQQLTGHDNIVKLQNVIKSDNNKDLYMIFEFMETDLHKVIRANLLNPLHKQYIIYQLLKSLKYIHSGDLIHRDLKPSNLLIDSECLVKVADFGLARSLAFSENDDQTPVMTEYVATRWYRAPEILFGSQKYSKAIDMWSVGCILGEMINGKAIFAGTSSLNQIEKVIELIGRPKPEDLEGLQAPLAAQILSTYTTNKKKSFAQFFQGASEEALDFIRNLLVFNPSNRMSVEDALNHKYMKDFKSTEQEIMLTEMITIPFNDNQKQTIKNYRDALYSGLTCKKKEDRKQLHTLNNTFFKVKDVVNRVPVKSGQSQSEHTQPTSEIKDDYMSQTQSGIYSTVNVRPNDSSANMRPNDSTVNVRPNDYTVNVRPYDNTVNIKPNGFSYVQSKQNLTPKRDDRFNQGSEEIPTVHKTYVSKYSEPQIATTSQPLYKGKSGYITEDHSKVNSRSISQSDEMKRNQILSDSQCNFNHYPNSKATYSKYSSKLNQIRQSSQSNSFLVQRQSKSQMPYEISHKVSNSSTQPYMYTKTTEVNKSQQQPNRITQTPYRSRSYEKQALLKVNPNQYFERSDSKQNTKLTVNSPFNSESKSNYNASSIQKTLMDKHSKSNLHSAQFVLRNERQTTQPSQGAMSGFHSSLNSVQKLLAKCTNPSYSSNSAPKKNQGTSYKSHNKSNSYMDIPQYKNQSALQSFNYFEKQMDSRNTSFKGTKNIK